MTANDALRRVRTALARHIGEFTGSYRVPRFLVDDGLVTSLVDIGDPYRFYIETIDAIASRRPSAVAGNSLTERDLVYLSFMRTFASLNGEIGTPLKQLAFLQHLRVRLGVSILVCLPTGVIGSTNRKGLRGSPFAVTNPFGVDRSLADPLLPEVPAITLYRALCEACNHLGLRVGSIVPMATLAIDSPLFRLFPDLGYWWLANPGEPLHASDSARWMLEGSYSPSVAAEGAVRRFCLPPPRDAVESASTLQGSFYTAHDSDGHPITLANAFPDVLASETESYTWEDVSLVRYIDSLTPPAVGMRPATTTADLVHISVLIMAAAMAWRYCELGENILIIDVAPNVPDAVLEAARTMCGVWPRGLGRRLCALASGRCAEGDADRLLAELGELAGSHHCGPSATDLYLVAEELWSFELPSSSYHAVTGPITPCVSAHAHDNAVLRESLRHHLMALADRPARNRHLPGVSNHDTNPPALDMSRRLFLFYSFLPGSTPLVFSGSEWGFEVIVNREFGFPPSSRTSYPLPPATASAALFNDCTCQWDALAVTVPSLHDLRQLVVLRFQGYDVSDKWSYAVLKEIHRDCVGYIRTAPGGGLAIAVIWNFGPVPRHSRLALGAVLDVLSWPAYASDFANLGLIPAKTVTVLVAESIVRSSFRTGGVA